MFCWNWFIIKGTRAALFSLQLSVLPDSIPLVGFSQSQTYQVFNVMKVPLLTWLDVEHLTRFGIHEQHRP